MRFPLVLRFKSLAVARQVTVEDATGRVFWYARAVTFALKESVTVYADPDQRKPLYKITSNSLIDVGALYEIQDIDAGTPIGAVQHLSKSIVHAHYEILRSGSAVFVVREENPFAKFMNNTLGVVPIVGQVVGYVFNPRYAITRAGRGAIARLVRDPTLFVERYSIDRTGALPPDEELLLSLGLLMVGFLEKQRV